MRTRTRTWILITILLILANLDPTIIAAWLVPLSSTYQAMTLASAGPLAQASGEVLSAAPAAPQQQPLVVGIAYEPDSLYLHHGYQYASQHIWSAIYDGPIDSLSFGYRPVILSELPSPGNGGLVVRTVAVQEGDWIVDADDQPITLTVGVRVRPAGCHADTCAIPYGGGPLQMDRMEATFELIEGLKWADGITLTADDSVYSFELYMDPDTLVPNPYIGERTAAYVAIDERRLRWTGLPGFWNRSYMISFWTPLPRHAWGHLTPAELLTAPESSRTPLGYGPYSVETWEPGVAITLTANPHYFRAGEGLPHFSTLVFRILGGNPTDAVAQLLDGHVDVLTQDFSLAQVADMLLALEQQDLLNAHFRTGDRWEHSDFGIDPVEQYAATRPDFFEDVRMRQAIAMCLNRAWAIEELLYGASPIPALYIPPEHPLYPPDIAPWPYDPNSAEELLEEMGWTDLDGDGIRECHGCEVEGAVEGTRLSFKWASTTAPIRRAYMEMFQLDLRGCGFDIVLDNVPAIWFFAEGPEGPVFGRKFDIASFAWGTGQEPPCGLYLSSQIPGEQTGWVGKNNPGFNDALYDAACEGAMAALPGTEAHVLYHQQAMRVFQQQLPVVPLYLPLPRINAGQPRLRGFGLDSAEESELYNVELWELDDQPPGLPAYLLALSPLNALPTGMHQAPITIQVQDWRGDFVSDGTIVTLSTTLGDFVESGSALLTVSTAGGLAHATLRSGVEEGDTLVTAIVGEAEDALVFRFYRANQFFLPVVLQDGP